MQYRGTATRRAMIPMLSDVSCWTLPFPSPIFEFSRRGRLFPKYGIDLLDQVFDIGRPHQQTAHKSTQPCLMTGNLLNHELLTFLVHVALRFLTEPRARLSPFLGQCRDCVKCQQPFFAIFLIRSRFRTGTAVQDRRCSSLLHLAGR